MQNIDVNQSFEDLYQLLLKASIEGNLTEVVSELKNGEFDQNHLDCLLNPNKQPLVWKLKDCDCGQECEANSDCSHGCVTACEFEATSTTENCVACGECIKHCEQNNLIESRDSIAVLEALKSKKQLVYAMIAPAFLGQFSSEVTPGKLRTSLKKLGFDGMLEVAVFADILTLKESFEFVENIHSDTDYQLTSCCCPMWIAMIRRVYDKLMPHVPASVSPMIACGRTVKVLHPDAITVFIGPCMAKKAEAREEDIKDAVDYVLTFQEMQNIFDVLEINPATLEDNEKEISSRAGRLYAVTGGISEAVKSTVERLDFGGTIAVRTEQADGVRACKEMLNNILEGHINANFYEGMGCVGGCVGGPKVMIDRQKAATNVTKYGEEAAYKTPIDNPYVIELMKRLGFDTPKDLLQKSFIFTRNF